jgi:RNA polymerase sigma-70 factor (ECF subfamily)
VANVRGVASRNDEPSSSTYFAPSASSARSAADALEVALNAVMDKYAQGDDDALEEFYRRAAPRVCAFLARLSGSWAVAEDLTQDAFLNICNARGDFVVGAPALPWMFAIARNALRDHFRRERVRRSYRVETVRLEGSSPSTAPCGIGESTAIARQTLGAVQEALMRLPVRQREAFVLLRGEGLSVDQAAEVLGATPGAVKVLAFRAYKALREAADEGGDLESVRRSTP